MISIPSNNFTFSNSDLPRTSFSFPLDYVIERLGLELSNIDVKDIFRFDAVITKSDGSTFNFANSSPNLSSSPFDNLLRFDVEIVCSVPDDYVTGSYHLLQTVGECFGFGCELPFEEIDVFIAKGETSEERVFEVEWWSFPSKMEFKLECGKTTVNAEAGASCGNGVYWISDADSGFGEYQLLDDSEITLVFWDDFENDCGFKDKIELTLTKK